MRYTAFLLAALVAGCSEVRPPSPPAGPGISAQPPSPPDVTTWPADLTISLTVTREYGLSIFTFCRLEVLVFEDNGRAALECQRTDGTAKRQQVGISRDDAIEIRELVRASDLYSGGHVGKDWTSGDGTVESLKVRPGGGGPAVVLVTSDNKTFEVEGPRRALLELLKTIESAMFKGLANRPPG